MNLLSHKLSFEHRLLLQQMNLVLMDSHVNYLYAGKLKERFIRHLYQMQLEGQTFQLPGKMTMEEYLNQQIPEMPKGHWYDQLLAYLVLFLGTMLPLFLVICLIGIRSGHEMQVDDSCLIMTSSYFTTLLSLLIPTFFFFILPSSLHSRHRLISSQPIVKLLQLLLTCGVLNLILAAVFPSGAILSIPFLPTIPILLVIVAAAVLLRYLCARHQLNTQTLSTINL